MRVWAKMGVIGKLESNINGRKGKMGIEFRWV